jgi:hypothetical protein
MKFGIQCVDIGKSSCKIVGVNKKVTPTIGAKIIRLNPGNPFHPFCYHVLVLIHKGNCRELNHPKQAQTPILIRVKPE